MRYFQKKPSLFWTLTDGPRAGFEWINFKLKQHSLLQLPKGDGHAVIFFPGLLGDDSSTRPMRQLFTDLGYKTYGWDLGQNLHFNDERETKMNALVERIYKKYGQKVSLIGWSLGGVFAREIAKSNPDMVRNVITLGSPISGDLDHTHAKRIYEIYNGKPDTVMKNRLTKIPIAPSVPTSCLYSKRDGIVSWKGAMQITEQKQTENIHIRSSHIGFGLNPKAMVIIANRLAQKEGEWQPYAT